ncbi:MAG: SPOR domain-containing protein [Rickettsiales bacterium]|nr:SPOR domain-containing protein [Rickettsiales bacterium]
MSKSGYRLVGKDGKVIYFEKKRPQFNEEQIKKQTDEKTKKLQKVNDDETVKKPVNAGENEDKAPLDSSAYSLKSVMDNMIKNEDINALAKKINVSQGKTIGDFDHIPDSFFENVPDGERLTVKQNQNFYQSKKIEKRRDVDELKVGASPSLVKNKYYLQLGSFKSREKAEKLLEKTKGMGETVRKVIESKRNDSTFYRVVIGAYNSKSEAQSAREKIIAGGHADVFVFNN